MIGVLYKGRQHVSMKGVGREEENIDKEQVGMNWEQVDIDKEHMHKEQVGLCEGS